MQLGFTLRALAQLRRRGLARGAIVGERGVECLKLRGDRGRSEADCREQPFDDRDELGVVGERGLHPLQAGRPRRPLAGLSLQGRPCGGDLGGELGAAAGMCPLIWRRAAALNLSLEASDRLALLIQSQGGRAMGGGEPLALGVALSRAPRGRLDVRARGELGLHGARALADQPLPPVALGEHAFLPDRRRLA